ncbi:septum formation initiator family protein [Patescibacteria group bacterium]|nr:septum formation initiator family protein [Patescibacteria group bacterium]MCL5410132.1 septum formation initiator family protein [Patescibacteria group bacterium]
MIRKVILCLFLLIFGAIFYNLGRQVFDSLQAGQRLDQSVDELTRLQDKNEELKEQLSQLDSPQFIEQQARDKLNLARSGETVVIIPPSEVDQVLKQNQPTPTPTPVPYYQGWFKLFFH